MTTLAELRLANLREQKKSAEPAPDAEPAAETAPVLDAVPAPAAEAAPPPATPAAPARAAREDDLVLSQYLSESADPLPPVEDIPDPDAERTAAFFERVQAALSTKTQHPSGAKVTVDMSTALFHRTKRYCLDHGNVTLRQLFLDLMTEFLNEEGY